MGKTDLVCEHCGRRAVERRPSGLYCTSCKSEIGAEHGRAVHHEGFPHVVTEEEEQ